MLDRPEFSHLKNKGYQFKDPFDIVDQFEKRVAKYIGSPYAVAVDCCTHAIELGLRYLQATGNIEIPRNTYLSVPMTVKKIGCDIQWTNENWNGSYRLSPYPVVDASVHFAPQTYKSKTFHCLSFQQKKTIPIGRGGMILVDDLNAYEWLIRASYDGRQRGLAWKDDSIETLGYHYYMTPEDAARGLLLMDELGDSLGKIGSFADYPDISKHGVFK